MTDTVCGPPIFSKLNFFPCARIWLQSNVTANESEGISKEVARKGRADDFMMIGDGVTKTKQTVGRRTSRFEDNKGV